jgi:nucleoside-diphosphate-sugar epimerase
MRLFVTGASGWLGSATVPALLTRGHEVVGLARSPESADALRAAGADVALGSLDDHDVLRSAADASDGVLHLAFKHDLAFTGDYAGAAAADRAVVDLFGEVLAGSDRPLVIASGLLGLAPGRLATEDIVPEAAGPGSDRLSTGVATQALAEKGVRSSVVRLPPTCHGEGDNGFVATLFESARSAGAAGYLGDGSNRWPATHRLDVAELFALAVESAPAGSALHAVAEEGVPLRQVAEAIARRLDVPAQSITPDEAPKYVSFLAGFVALDSPASGTATQSLLDWHPSHPTLLDDIDAGRYG